MAITPFASGYQEALYDMARAFVAAGNDEDGFLTWFIENANKGIDPNVYARVQEYDAEKER